MSAEVLLINEIGLKQRRDRPVRVTGLLIGFDATLNCGVLQDSTGNARVILEMSLSGYNALVIGRLYRVIGTVHEIDKARKASDTL